MNRSEEILRPPTPFFIAITIGCALFLNLLPWEGLAKVAGPDFLLVTLLYWCVTDPRRIGIGISWAMGLVMDVANGNLLGQHALAYAVAAFAALLLHRRLHLFSGWKQSLHILPALFAAEAVVFVVRTMVTGAHANFTFLFAPLTGAALWPLILVVFVLPRRRKGVLDGA